MIKWLIIDDDSEDQDIFEIALREVNTTLELIRASNGLEALQLLRSFDPAAYPDKIFLDINMPKMDGRECLRELKKDEQLKSIPVIIYSTSSDQRDRAELLHLGATSFLTKPSNLPDVVNIIRSFVPG